MRWYEDLYVGYNLLDKKRQVIRKIKNGKKITQVEIIITAIIVVMKENILMKMLM